jgi:hypothetical protein
MANISNPTFGAATLPFPSEAVIAPVWVSADNVTLGGKSRRDVMARKYQYTMKWDYISVSDYNALETVVNELIPATFVYGKWPQSSSPGVSCLGTLSARQLMVGIGDAYYWSSVTLTLVEVESRI